MREYTLTELATKTRSVVEAANSGGVVRIVRKVHGREWGAQFREEAACFVAGAEQFDEMEAVIKSAAEMLNYARHLAAVNRDERALEYFDNSKASVLFNLGEE